ncbi:polysaccharide pyruvyl transferase family protein [Aromatoleum aromaticum]|uniref:Succinoglycan biosynthesis protein n=1 Tax=Aromatoleum aromaticum (strain DSM 19018 / LMG 30748 / EbN1) TaxID=76114 RepID=Q5P2B0_AROAE|nr:polysaccharide pyruvyl transferase family protein [Aromatoleum aromaticum]NMG56086.1 hypothetical protein [Aromatoleum aromaticum]CAI08554.1 Succinoglycan biosynthesis protein [Aromatoleum aromaticum EbN1]
MEMYWCRTTPPNVGDALNTWLWPKLVPRLSTLDVAGTLYGIGSVLDERLNSPGPKYILGSGTRSKEHGISPQTDLRVFSVRGPLTAAALGISPKLGIIDPASMVARLYRINNPQRYEIGIVPYFSAPHDLWSIMAERLGYQLVSPCLNVEAFLENLSRCKFVIAEAMHGAILADSLRIPWRAIRANSVELEGGTNTFKWTDWCRSVELPFSPVALPPLWNNAKAKPRGEFRSKLKMYWIERKLRSISSENAWLLSSDSVLNDRLDRLQDAVSTFERVVDA